MSECEETVGPDFFREPSGEGDPIAFLVGAPRSILWAALRAAEARGRLRGLEEAAGIAEAKAEGEWERARRPYVSNEVHQRLVACASVAVEIAAAIRDEARAAGERGERG